MAQGIKPPGQNADNGEVARPMPKPHGARRPAHGRRRWGGRGGGRGQVIHVATRCASVDEFVERFAAFAWEGSLVLPAASRLPIGTQGRFVIVLRDKIGGDAREVPRHRGEAGAVQQPEQRDRPSS